MVIVIMHCIACNKDDRLRIILKSECCGGYNALAGETT